MLAVSLNSWKTLLCSRHLDKCEQQLCRLDIVTDEVKHRYMTERDMPDRILYFAGLAQNIIRNKSAIELSEQASGILKNAYLRQVNAA